MTPDDSRHRPLIEAPILSDRDRRAQRAIFALLLADGRPVSVAEAAAAADMDESEMSASVKFFGAAGRTRVDSDGRLTGIAGLSVEPTRHQIRIGPLDDVPSTGSGSVVRWTWCALDAIGIIGALGRGGRLTSHLPEDTDPAADHGPLVVEFDGAQPRPTGTVILLSDGYGEAPIVDNWCPTVNLFPESDTALRWAANRGISGRAVPVADLMADAIAMWAPVVPRSS